ncbi:hypothetical protein V8C37DRAFT_376573 [Trichoderma ceciliae]
MSALGPKLTILLQILFCAHTEKEATLTGLLLPQGPPILAREILSSVWLSLICPRQFPIAGIARHAELLLLPVCY